MTASVLSLCTFASLERTSLHHLQASPPSPLFTITVTFSLLFHRVFFLYRYQFSSPCCANKVTWCCVCCCCTSYMHVSCAIWPQSSLMLSRIITGVLEALRLSDITLCLWSRVLVAVLKTSPFSLLGTGKTPSWVGWEPIDPFWKLFSPWWRHLCIGTFFIWLSRKSKRFLSDQPAVVVF